MSHLRAILKPSIGSRALHDRATTWTPWDLAIAVLGLNIWVSFLLLPVLHLEQPGHMEGGLIPLLACSLICLGLGVLWRGRLLLLTLYPASLLLPVLVTPQLVGANVYTRWTFVLVAASLLAYMLVTPLLLGLMERPPSPTQIRDVEGLSLDAKWRRRIRVYRGLAMLAGMFPLVLVATLYLHSGVKADLERHFPGRVSEAWTLFGLVLLLLWVGLFHSYFLNPLRAHIRGDPQTRHEVQRLRRDIFRRRVRALFYIHVAVALALMLLLVLVVR